LFWFLLDAAGIDTYLICDYINGHAYNMAVINGTGYIIDTTWDSGNWYQFGKITQFKRMINKDYFMPDISQSYRLRGW
jgi:transglutaminase/protease-like cytokinesis protein 3